MLPSKKTIISVCASRTGSGKSPTSRWLLSKMKDRGIKVVVVRHPMPYGNIKKQTVQRFEFIDDLDKYECTIEEREDYEPHLEKGAIVFAGVDYEQVLKEAEKEADIILWDGGNNDFPFFKPTIHIVLVDPHRPGHELSYYPGETNVRMADIIIVSKVNTAKSILFLALAICFIISISGLWSGANKIFMGTSETLTISGTGSCPSLSFPKCPCIISLNSLR